MAKPLSEWLQLRESTDAVSRAVKLTTALANTFNPSMSVRLLDLGTGTGSNLRYLLERLPPRQHWVAIDRDATLLSELVRRLSSWAQIRGYDVQQTACSCVIRSETVWWRVEAEPHDLDSLPDDLFEGRHLVTASALLDLCPADWLRSLARRCRAAGASALFAMTYNGRSSCSPVEPEDDLIRTLLNRHQKREHGRRTPAAGPDAIDSAARAFAHEGYAVRREPSDWLLGVAHAALQQELLAGWAEAAVEMAPDLAPSITAWHERRLEHLRKGRSTIVVGHEDLLALPLEAGAEPPPI